MKGVALLLYPDQRMRSTRAELGIADALREIAKLGATHAQLVVTWYQRDVADTNLGPGDRTASDLHVRRTIRAAHKAGLKVLLFPIIYLEKTRPGEWRGTVRPSDVGAWWTKYEAFILHYAEIAKTENVEALSIGSELSSTESWRYRWYHLISQVEQAYDGDLVYSANFDHFPGVSFWRRVDYLGVNGYFGLSDRDDATAEELLRGWVKPRKLLRAYAAKLGKPLWITEVGYGSRNGAAVQPWDYDKRHARDLEEQRRCYVALREAWDGIVELDGLFIWNWHGLGGRRDSDYTPRGKPAEKVLRTWWAGR